MKFFKHVKYTLLLGLLSVLLLAPSVDASQFSFSQSPQSHEVVAKPGSTVVLPFTLTNVGDPSVMELHIYAVNIEDSTGAYGIIPYYSDNPQAIQFSLHNSTHLLSEPFFIHTSEAIAYEVAILVPDGVQSGDYYFAVVGQAEQNDGYVDASTLSIQGGVGSLIYLTVSTDGTLDQAGSISQFGVQSNYSIHLGNVEYVLFDSFQEIPFILQLTNTGANLFRANGTISVRPRFFGSGSKLIILDATYILSESGKTLLSSESRDRNNSARIQAPFIGIYSAQAAVNIGSPGHAQVSDTAYIVFPFSYILYLVGAVLFTATGVVFMKRITKE
ncbi:hypothetical protein CO051_03730 [Candidatus Roizmanbacteria bacterium CG_4_9_14_0_2_um_filter_39_13]|uniref:CARDB domain-containing protein n=1 Tax=Candidatus Roizmanbacteria bacterium CG_4_9_14_0_2_um_filter_39_13 TaxID=1974839 RepID=A0A2M8EYT4_9BACT|nr:MAG: hypothetical protein COY15_03560 [Candidatus Roizmanbacteria bacterium CG_4_10_14_0_2_um_filter_39_12]PJC31791.1 MAG: hypothetical protein CO051_03730 [Candidatus Roizmanbacteria bacterium CG_4_9_14_0_2_um_filter_39_13]